MSVTNHPAALWSAISRGAVSEIANELFSRTAVSSAIPEETGPQHPMSRCPGLVERPVPSASPCADTGTAGVSDSSHRAFVYKHERLIEQLYDLARAERFDELHDVVRAEYLAIHGPSR